MTTRRETIKALAAALVAGSPAVARPNEDADLLRLGADLDAALAAADRIRENWQQLLHDLADRATFDEGAARLMQADTDRARVKEITREIAACEARTARGLQIKLKALSRGPMNSAMLESIAADVDRMASEA